MKNIISKLSAFFLGLFVCVAIFACAKDADGSVGDNTIAVLSEKIAELTERLKTVEDEIQTSLPPKVLSAEWQDPGEYGGSSSTIYEFDNTGRLIKVTESYTGYKGSDTSVINITYNENSCLIKSSDSSKQYVLNFDDISNVKAVNNLIVSIMTEPNIEY